MSPIAKRRHSFRRPLALLTSLVYLASVGWPPSALASVPAGPLPAAAAAIPTPSASGSRIYFFHPDHLGSTNLVTDERGEVVEFTEYTPFGSIARHEEAAVSPSPQPSAPSEFGFTGQRFDAGTGLYYYHARYYDPELGRFLQPDPLVQAPADPQSLNRYAYCRNNPINYTDPSGYFRVNIFGFGFEISSHNVSVSIAGATVGYDWKRNELFVGVQVGFQIGEIGGVGRAGVYYNFSSQQVGFVQGAYVGPASLESRHYYDFREGAFGTSVDVTALGVPVATFNANTDGQRSFDLFGQNIPIKAEKPAATVQAIVQDFGASAGRAADEITRAILAPQPLNANVLQLVEGLGWMAVGGALAVADGPLLFGDAVGVPAIVYGLGELRAALAVGSAAYGVAVLEGAQAEPEIYFRGGHRKKRPSTKEMHEEGQARQRRDQGGERGDVRRLRPKKRFGGARYQ